MSDSLTALHSALATVTDPALLTTLALGVVIGLAVGVLPGIGGLAGLALLLPFTFHLDPMAALAMLVAMHAVVATSDSIPAILFGVPGTVGSAATIVDGHKMAQQGDAVRGLSAAFTASLLGGLFGALLLALAIPLLRPILLLVGSPEMFALCIFGLSLSAALSGANFARGMAAVAAGLLLSTVGEDLQTGEPRLTFSSLYLWDGIPLVPLALGLFAIPEMAEFARKGARPAPQGTRFSGDGWTRGLRDVARAPRVLFQSSALGVGLGMLPGLGSAVIDWIAYGAASRMKLDRNRFGQGDVRGVIASEAANNAKEGGALIPTIAFGVPGSAAMSILLGGFVIHGVTPGPEMLNERLDVTYLLVFSLVLANVLGAALCLGAVPVLARIPTLPVAFVVPFICALMFIGAFQGNQSWGDIVVLIASGALGLAMKSMNWPRPPLLLGFVLGVLIERYLATSVQIYGLGFLTRPVVLVILAVTLASLWQQLRRRAAMPYPERPEAPDHGLLALLVLGFAGTIAMSFAWPTAARLMPVAVSVAGLGFCAVLCLRHLAGGQKTETRALEPDDTTGSPLFPWLLLLALLALAAGPLEGLTIWIAAAAMLRFRAPALASGLFAAAFYLAGVFLFERTLGMRFPDPVWSYL